MIYILVEILVDRIYSNEKYPGNHHGAPNTAYISSLVQRDFENHIDSLSVQDIPFKCRVIY